jgi:hypothetical protein
LSLNLPILSSQQPITLNLCLPSAAPPNGASPANILNEADESQRVWKSKSPSLPPHRKGKRDSGCMTFSGSKTGQFVQDLLPENLVLLHAEFTLIA